MTAPTLELTEGLSDMLSGVLDPPRSDWTPEGAEHWVAGVELLRRYVVGIKELAQALLQRGVEARAFVMHFEAAAALLEKCLAGYSRLEAKGLLAAAPAEVADAFADVRTDVAACRDFLGEALAKAKAPPPAIDWRRLKQESDADFAAGRSVAYNTPEEMLADLAGGA